LTKKEEKKEIKCTIGFCYFDRFLRAIATTMTIIIIIAAARAIVAWGCKNRLLLGVGEGVGDEDEEGAEEGEAVGLEEGRGDGEGVLVETCCVGELTVNVSVFEFTVVPSESVILQ
jgi:hypothetical protein